MADYFADRYWGTQYWTVRYFQGGEVDPNAMSASLSGSGTIGATLSIAEQIHQGGHDSLYLAKKRKKRKAIVKEEEIVYIDDDEVLVAFVEAFLRDAA
jgi:hypothetical protein